MDKSPVINKRVVVVYWKNKKEEPFEVFSSLKNFCLSYKDYNYNTLSNYLSREKIAYDNDNVHIERKNIILKPKTGNSTVIKRSIVPVVRKVPLKEANDAAHDVTYWLTRPASERVAAATYLMLQSLEKGQKIDKTRIVKRKLKG